MANYKLVQFERQGAHRGFVCHGPGGHSSLAAIYNCLHLKRAYVAPDVTRQVLLTEQMLKDGIKTFLTLSLEKLELSGTFERAVLNEAKPQYESMIDSLPDGLDICPLLKSITAFKETPGCDLLSLLGISLLNGWLVNPQDKIIYETVKNYSYDELVSYFTSLKDVNEGLEAANRDVAAKCALIERLLAAAKNHSTSHGFTSLCQGVEMGETAVLYWGGNFSVIHEKDGTLLILETDRDFLDTYPQATWMVLEEVNEEKIYLNSRYTPAANQPHINKARAWYREKLSNVPRKTGGSSSNEELAYKFGKKNEEGASKKDLSDVEEKNRDTEASSEQLTRNQRRRNNKRLNRARAREEKQGDSHEAATCSHAGEERTKTQANERLEKGGEAQEAATSSHDKLDHPSVPGQSSCPTAEQGNKGQENEREKNNGDREAAMQDHPIPITKEDEDLSIIVDDFLKFLLEFQDGSSRNEVPYFEGIVEAMKHLGSEKLYVPYDFIKKYNKGLALKIQDHQARIYEDLTQSVVLYLCHHGFDLLHVFLHAELEIQNLSEPERCTDKLRKNIANGTKRMDAMSEEELVSSISPEKSVDREIAWARTQIEMVEERILLPSQKSVLMGDVNLSRFMQVLMSSDLQVELQDDGGLLCGGSILVYKSYTHEVGSRYSILSCTCSCHDLMS